MFWPIQNWLRVDMYHAQNFGARLVFLFMRNGETAGVFVLTRPEVRPYSDQQIELVKTFATRP